MKFQTVVNAMVRAHLAGHLTQGMNLTSQYWRQCEGDVAALLSGVVKVSERAGLARAIHDQAAIIRAEITQG